VPLSVEESMGPVKYTGPRPTSVLSGISINPTVWPRYTNDMPIQTGNTDSTRHNGSEAYGEPLLVKAKFHYAILVADLLARC